MKRDVAAILRDHGIQPSAQRLAVAAYVLDTDEHPSAEEVLRHAKANLPMISRATVYNTLNLFVKRGLIRELVLSAWPMDFTFVCPTEIAEFGHRYHDFFERGAQVLGFSTDTHYVHLAWRQQHPALKSLPFPMLADTKRELSQALGILHKDDGVALRATFIVDPEGVIRFASVHDLSVGRNVDEVVRT